MVAALVLAAIASAALQACRLALLQVQQLHTLCLQWEQQRYLCAAAPTLALALASLVAAFALAAMASAALQACRLSC